MLGNPWKAAQKCMGPGLLAVEDGGETQALPVRPNVRAKLPAEAGFVSPVRDDSTTGADRAYKACRSGSA
jgi:hypothetical protein